MKKIIIFSLFLSWMGITAQNQVGFIKPSENLITENIPDIPVELSVQVKKYTESRGANLVALHPIKKEMIISTRFANTSQLHVVNQPLGMRKQITFFEEPIGNASFEPTKGEYLILSKDVGGNEFAQLYKYDLKTLQLTLLTDGGRSQNGNINWRKDGKGFFFASTMRNGKDRDIYYMNPNDITSIKMILQVEGGGWSIHDISEDSKVLIVGEYISANESHLWLLNVEDGKLTEFTPRNQKGVVSEQGTFAKNQNGIYYITDFENEFTQLVFKDFSTNQVQYLSQIPWDVERFEVSEDGKNILFSTNEAGASKLYKLDTKTQKYSILPGIPMGSIGGFGFHKSLPLIGITLSNAQSSSDVYYYDLKNNKLEKWTESELGGIQPEDISTPKFIEWKSFDGLNISGFYYPAASKFKGKRPVIINIHGGPEGQSLPNFLGSNNYFTNEMGIAIIYPNVRGSSGFGKTFIQLDNGFLREDSVKDIGALLDWIKTQPDLDAERIMIMGGSYGGYMTLAVSFHYADKIKCAIDVVGISNFNTFLKNTESYRRDLRRVEYGDERDPEMYAFLDRISPLNNTDKIKKPMLIIQGTNDPRVPVTEAMQMRDKLKANGNIVWYLEAKDEGHGFRKKNNVDYQRLVTIQFIEAYLLK